MSFADKKGITVASGFKLQAAALLDGRGQVDTIADRDELVAIHAVTEGLDVYVKETKTKYTWNGESWDEVSKGQGYVHPDSPGYKHIPAGGTVGQVLKNKASGEAEWGNLSAADVGAIPTTAKGTANGVASLDVSGKVPAAQLPFGETASTIFSGEKGKTAYDHSQVSHAPANAEANVQSDWNESSTSSDAYIKNKPTSMPANGGNADTVGGHTVETNVPANAEFTDTVYTHPNNHPASMITPDETHRFVSDTEKEKWNNKSEVYFASELPSEAAPGSLCFLIK